MMEVENQGAAGCRIKFIMGRRLDYRTQYSKDLFGTRVNCRFFTTCDSVGLQLFATAEEGNKDTI